MHKTIFSLVFLYILLVLGTYLITLKNMLKTLLVILEKIPIFSLYTKKQKVRQMQSLLSFHYVTFANVVYTVILFTDKIHME